MRFYCRIGFPVRKSYLSNSKRRLSQEQEFDRVGSEKQQFIRRRRFVSSFLWSKRVSVDVLSQKFCLECPRASCLYRLQYLDLSMNKLTKVPVRLPRSLKRLHIEKNELDYIPVDAFAKLKVIV